DQERLERPVAQVARPITTAMAPASLVAPAAVAVAVAKVVVVVAKGRAAVAVAAAARVAIQIATRPMVSTKSVLVGQAPTSVTGEVAAVPGVKADTAEPGPPVAVVAPVVARLKSSPPDGSSRWDRTLSREVEMVPCRAPMAAASRGTAATAAKAPAGLLVTVAGQPVRVVPQVPVALARKVVRGAAGEPPVAAAVALVGPSRSSAHGSTSTARPR
ncbi:MAG: hypothetical protein K2X97_09160, partial [Mycobacteriaceae bacterium]|nr:hypothetical protein [Mycobacteriaceae bacterium]